MSVHVFAVKISRRLVVLQEDLDAKESGKKGKKKVSIPASNVSFVTVALLFCFAPENLYCALNGKV